MNLKSMINIFLVCSLLLPALLLNSCSSGSIMDNPEMYRDQVLGWINRTLENPHDLEALKKLSAYYVQTHDKEKANYYLGKALEEKPDDPELIFYKGLNLEFYEEQEKALEYYLRFRDVSEDSPYKELLEGRYHWLKRQNDYADVKSIIKSVT